MQSSDLPHIPHHPGIYIFLTAGGKRLYIGKAKNLHKRVSQYFSPGSIRKQDMVHKAARLEYITTSSEHEALLLEENMIREHRPPYNSLLKGDTSYTYIKIPHEPFARIYLTRFRDTDKATYIGPKINKKDLRAIIKTLRQLLMYRGCSTSVFRKGKICSDYYFGLCAGRCVYAKMPQHNYPHYHDQAVRQGFSPDYQTHDDATHAYRQLITMIKNYFTGKSNVLKTHIKKQITHAIEHEQFERAAKLRDVYYSLEQFVDKQHVFLDKKTAGLVVRLTPVGTYIVGVVLVFFDGKLADVIRLHRHSDDTTPDDLLHEIRTEYDTELIPLSIPTPEPAQTHSISTDYTTPTLLAHLSKKTNDISEFLERATSSYIAQTQMADHNLLDELLRVIQERYQLTHFPYKIECIDISHLSGSNISGGLSCIEGGLPAKKHYRQYKIQSVDSRGTGSDDYQSLYEVITRRFGLGAITEPDPLWPHCLIIDGGKGQLGIIERLREEFGDMEIVLEHVDILALGKGDARSRRGKQRGTVETIYRYNPPSGQINETSVIYDDADRLLIKLRDEAHRFANRYRTKQMSKERGG